jgi:putative RNA 2'-phosphotransferase
MDQRRMVKVSKFLSKHLRHTPEELGLTLAPGGWVEASALLAGCERVGFAVTADELREVVEKSDKQRFAFDEDRRRIRANQGHSTEVDLQLEPRTPPDVLYHGTAADSVEAIRKTGLQRMARHHVHLSSTAPTARTVGARHGAPVVLTIDAAAMHRAGILFYCSDNGVWLVDAVGPEYLRVP